MKININSEKTTNNSLIKRNNLLIVNESIWFNKNTQSSEYSVEHLKNRIENDSILNYPYDFISLQDSEKSIPAIITINLVDNINIKTQENIFEHYDRNTGEITITEKLLFNEQFLPNTFPEHLYASVGQSKLLIFAILHEIGHAIHHQLFLKQKGNLITPSTNDFNNNDFLNLISNNGIYLLGKSENNKKYDINHSINYAIKEGFADLYGCIGLRQLYSKEVALSFISEIIDARIIGNDHYYTIDSLKKFKVDFENDLLIFNDFDSMHAYIDQTVSNTALKCMLDKLSSNNPDQIMHNNAFAGYLKSLFYKCYQQDLITEDILQNSHNINEVIESLQLNDNIFNIQLESIDIDSDNFIKGYKATENMIQNIYESHFLSEKLNKRFKTTLVNKISIIRGEYLSYEKFKLNNKTI